MNFLRDADVPNKIIKLIDVDHHDDISFYYQSKFTQPFFFGDRLKTQPIASLSKQFTAAVIKNMGSVKMDQEIDSFFPQFKDSNICVRDLLNHTSGIPEYLIIPTDKELIHLSLDDCTKLIGTLERKTQKNLNIQIAIMFYCQK